MNARSTLKRSDYEDYLVYLYFGAKSDCLSRCIDRAYLDFSRTLWGLSKLASRDKNNDLASVTGQAAFDKWHEATCQQLSAIYNEHDYHLFVGQAQKWINMTFKYIFTLSELGKYRRPGLGEVYPFCHAPLDRLLIHRLSKKYDIPWPHQCAWSRLDNYNHYLCYQQQIRQRFVPVPLDVEFLLWMGKDVETTDTT